MRLGIQATPHAGFSDLPTGLRIVLVDVYEHPDSTIGQIVERTGFPQSQVSDAVARLRETGVLVTATDPQDRRRTLVRAARRRPRVTASARSSTLVEHEITELLVKLHGAQGSARTTEVVQALDRLSSLLCPAVQDSSTGGAPC